MESGSGFLSPSIQKTSSAFPAVETVLLDVPSTATGQFSGFTFEVRDGFKVCRALGWTVTLARHPFRRLEAAVLPQTLPTTSLGVRASAAAVTLPEAGVMKQYWVTVLEHHLGAVLHTPEWTAVFHKLPSAHA